MPKPPDYNIGRNIRYGKFFIVYLNVSADEYKIFPVFFTFKKTLKSRLGLHGRFPDIILKLKLNRGVIELGIKGKRLSYLIAKAFGKNFII